MLRKKSVFFISLIILSVFFITTYILLAYLPGNISEVKRNRIEELIYNELQTLPNIYYSPQKQDDKFDELLRNIKNRPRDDEKINSLWLEANSWVNENQLFNISSSELGNIITAMKTAKIIKSDIDSRGTQFKLLLTLKGNQQVVFKPKWYDEAKVIEGPVYSGKDRYQSEIVAFYLSLLLKKPLTPISVKRNISFKYEILPVATKRLLSTSYENSNKSTCIYGKCFYCKKEDPVCEDKANMLTGVLIFNIQKSFNNYRSPWQRTYKKNKNALWQDDSNYCKTVKTKLTKRRLLDLIETSIFDFLMQNGDRHHYETFNNQVLWIDNGKGLGNPFIQHIDILAPLYQCCMIRDNMLKNLLNLAGGELSRRMWLMPEVKDLLTRDHLNAMEKRLLLVFATVEYCRKETTSEYLHKIV